MRFVQLGLLWYKYRFISAMPFFDCLVVNQIRQRNYQDVRTLRDAIQKAKRQNYLSGRKLYL